MPAPWQPFLVAEKLNMPPRRARVTIPATLTKIPPLRSLTSHVYPTAPRPNPKMPTLRKLANAASTATAKTTLLSLEQGIQFCCEYEFDGPRSICMDSQIVEMLGRNHLVGELIRSDLEVSLPLRDRGVDLIAYADLLSSVPTFRARPIQMKAASNRSFGLDQKYAKFPIC